MRKLSQKFRILLAIAFALVIAVVVPFTAQPAHAQFGDLMGNCVPWCPGDGPVEQTTWQGTDVYVHNHSSEKVWVAMLYFQEGDDSSSCLSYSSPDCARNDRWTLAGWYEIPAYLPEAILTNYTNQNIYLYVQGEEGGVWGGSAVYRYVVNNSMDTASSLANISGAYNVGFFKVDVGNRNDEYTLNLNP